jgi:putative flippase GtrA
MAHQPEPDSALARRRGIMRFSKYTLLSVITVPVGYTLLLLARHFWDINAGLLNLAVGTVLTPPSFLLYRSVVWRDAGSKGWLAELLAFWQTVMAGALASSVLIAGVDLVFANNGFLIVLAGLLGQGIIFVVRFFWLDRVTFVSRPTDGNAPISPS